MSDFASIKLKTNLRVEIENETRVFLESLVFEIEMKSCRSLGYKIGLAKFVLKKILKLNSGVQAKT